MTLSPGTRIGSYEIAAQIGAGGMGEVYRATDTNLKRQVAIKVLPETLAGDPERLARFQREAEMLAALNHPNIAHIHGLERSDGTTALVMELVEGPTLAERLSAQGSGLPALDSRTSAQHSGLPLDEALPIARQIAEALEAAHEQGIIHRDLKPANIKVRDDGTVKVLDFGLAKALEPGAGMREARLAELSQSPTITTPAMTQAGMILGTAAYMSPEQARGKTVDRRADIWAFGCVLYKMLTGRRAFGGEDVTDTIVAVVSKEPDWTAVPSHAPEVGSLLRRCLEKDPKRRLRDIGEARIALERSVSGVVESGRVLIGGAPERTAPVSATSHRVPWILASLATAIAIVVAGLLVLRPTPAARSLVLEMTAPRDTDFEFGANQGGGVISPDGSAVAFLARSKDGTSLWVRSLATGEARALPGTEGAFYPFWSPDSRTLGFFVLGQLMKVDIGGGLPEAVAAATIGRGGSWSDSGEILFTPAGGGTVHRVSADGGPVEEVTRLDTARGENAHYWPVWLPGGTRFLYFVRSTRAEDNAIYLGSVDGRAPVRLVTSLSSGAYAPRLDDHPGYLLWARGDELLAQPLDVDAGRLTSDAVVVTSDVRVEDAQRALMATVSQTGTIVWASASAAGNVLAWYDRDGRRGETVPIEAGPLTKIVQPRLSPDGRRLAFTRVTGGTADIWVYDMESRTTTQATTDPGYEEQPVWWPDGTALAYSATGEVISRTTLDGSRANVSLQSSALANPSSFTPDGAFLILTLEGAETGLDLAYVNASHPGAVMPLVVEAGQQNQASVSPDGRWIAFSHELSGRPQVVVAPLAREGDTLMVGRPWIPISRDGGRQSVWRNDGRELAFGGTDLILYSVAVTPAGASLRIGQPDALFKLPASSGGPSWTATPDFKRFVAVEQPGAVGQTLHVMTNWQAHIAK